jgi:hypothetical protein
MEEAVKIFEYLPLSYKTPTEAEYVEFLWQSYEVNYREEKYPFAFIAFNMLYMSFVYFEVWQIKQNRPKEFEMAMVGFNKDHEVGLINATTPFAFWLINESSFFRFLKLLNCRNDRIGDFATIIKARNESAHSNGNIFFKSAEALDAKVSDVLRFVAEIQTLFKPILESCLREFLVNSWDENLRQYPDIEDEIRENLVHEHYLSQKDIEMMRAFDIASLKKEPNFKQIEKLFHAFVNLFEVDEGSV